MTETDLTLTEGEGDIIQHSNGDITVVPTGTSDDDKAALAKLDGADVAAAIDTRAEQAAKDAAAKEREQAAQDIVQHPEDVSSSSSGAADISSAGRTDAAVVEGQQADTGASTGLTDTQPVAPVHDAGQTDGDQAGATTPEPGFTG